MVQQRFVDHRELFKIGSLIELFPYSLKGFLLNVAAKPDQTPADQQKAFKTGGAPKFSRTDPSQVSNRPYVVDKDFIWKTRNCAPVDHVKVRKKEAAKRAEDEYEDRSETFIDIIFPSALLILISGIKIYFEQYCK